MNRAPSPGAPADGAQQRRAELVRSYRDSGEVLVTQTRSRLVKLAQRSGLDLAAAKDVVQQAFATLFDKRPQLQDVEGWLVRVVQRGASAWRRTEKAWASDICPTTLPDEPIARLSAEQRLAVRAVLGRLAERPRRLVIARYFEGHTEEESARLAGYSPGAFKQTMTRALRRMRRELEKGCAEAKPERSG